MKRFRLQGCQLPASATYTKILILSCAAPVSQRGGGGWISATALRQQLTQRTHFQPAWGRQWSKCHQSCSSAVVVRLQAPAEKLPLRLFLFFLHISSKIPIPFLCSTLKVFPTHFAVLPMSNAAPYQNLTCYYTTTVDISLIYGAADSIWHFAGTSWRYVMSMLGPNTCCDFSLCQVHISVYKLSPSALWYHVGVVSSVCLTLPFCCSNCDWTQENQH